MVVISDTSPINYLCQIGQVEILAAIFGHVVIPTAVLTELLHAAAPESVRNFLAETPEWIEIREPAESGSLTADLGLGERQAIALAEELQANFLIVDDMEARLAAEQRHISVIGTLGVLKLAAQRKLVSLSKVVEDLQKSGFHMSDSLIKELLGESPDLGRE